MWLSAFGTSLKWVMPLPRVVLCYTLACVTLMAVSPAVAGAADGTACQRSDSLDDVTTKSAMGTSFVGTYLGDRVGTGDMTHYWDVERVYAGGPLPDHLTFMSAECEWVNLTPGVRYVFSTSANLGQPSEPFDGPSVSNSLAWELRDVQEVRLAPFGAYTVEAYKDDLRSIATLDEVLAAIAPEGGSGEAPQAVEPAEEGCAVPFRVATPAEAQGTTFVGTYIGDEALPSGGLTDRRVVWSVDRVYAGGPLPEVLTFRSPACIPTTLEPGRRYLFSTSHIGAPSQWDSLAWRVVKGNRVRFAPFDDGYTLKETGSSDLIAIGTFAEALQAVAPEAGDGEPPMRSADRTP